MAQPAQEGKTGLGNEHDAVQNRNQLHVKAHITIEDMAELVGNHPLQLVTVERQQQPVSYLDHRAITG